MDLLGFTEVITSGVCRLDNADVVVEVEFLESPGIGWGLGGGGGGVTMDC